MKKTILLLICSLFTTAPIFAFAAGNAKSAEAKMSAACKKEYSSEVKGKNTTEISEWVETKEKGPDAEAFKKSKCYARHEDWEKAAGKAEMDEKHE